MECEGSRPVAPRLLLAESLGWFALDRPVLIPAGAVSGPSPTLS
ncbi:hypothetical protein [Actinacidiphila yanglinensis]|nr:hypothetical protein [Actinacidiphila yanglinensis]